MDARPAEPWRQWRRRPPPEGWWRQPAAAHSATVPPSCSSKGAARGTRCSRLQKALRRHGRPAPALSPPFAACGACRPFAGDARRKTKPCSLGSRTTAPLFPCGGLLAPQLARHPLTSYFRASKPPFEPFCASARRASRLCRSRAAARRQVEMKARFRSLQARAAADQTTLPRRPFSCSPFCPVLAIPEGCRTHKLAGVEGWARRVHSPVQGQREARLAASAAQQSLVNRVRERSVSHPSCRMARRRTRLVGLDRRRCLNRPFTAALPPAAG